MLTTMGIRYSEGWVCTQTGWQVEIAVNVQDTTLWEPLLKRADADADGYVSRHEFKRGVEDTPLENMWEGAWLVVSGLGASFKPGGTMPNAMSIIGRCWEGGPAPVFKDDLVGRGIDPGATHCPCRRRVPCLPFDDFLPATMPLKKHGPPPSAPKLSFLSPDQARRKPWWW